MKKGNLVYYLLVGFVAFFLLFGFLGPAVVSAQSDRDDAIEEVRAAIRALPDVKDITEADRAQVEAVRDLAASVMAQYNLRALDLCVLSGKLNAALEGVGLERLESAPVDRAPAALPQTGGLHVLAPMGLLSIITGLGLLKLRRG